MGIPVGRLVPTPAVKEMPVPWVELELLQGPKYTKKGRRAWCQRSLASFHKTGQLGLSFEKEEKTY